jgi:hypothetical protein
LDGAAFAACSSPKSYSDLADGSHTFQVRATDAAANTDPTPASSSWTIETTAPGQLSVTGTYEMANGSTMAVTITGTGFAAGATLTFQGGEGPAPTASNVAFVSATQITATITAKSGGPPRDRFWDVVVGINGSTATCTDCLTVHQ